MGPAYNVRASIAAVSSCAESPAFVRCLDNIWDLHASHACKGIQCRFRGKATYLDDLWELLVFVLSKCMHCCIRDQATQELCSK